MSSRPLELSVVVPVYRNRETLPELVARIGSVFSGERYELLLVDDACPDGSGNVIEELAAADGAIVPLHLQVNAGQQRAVLAGLEAARGRWCAVLDADLQDPPEALRLLLARAREGDVDAVFGGRRGQYTSRWRAVTGQAHRRLRSLLLPLPVDAGLFVVLSRHAVDRVLELRGPTPSVVAMVGCAGLRAVSVGVVRERRSSSSSSYSEAMRLRAARDSLAWGLRYRRGRLARAR